METLRTNWGKIIVIVIACAIIDIILHALWAPLYEYDFFQPSFFVKNRLFKPAATVSLIIVYTALAVVFAFIQEKLSGNRLSKGFRFGISFGGLWFIGLPGTSIFFGSPMKHELLTGALDGISLLILGLLLGMFAATDSNQIAIKKTKKIVLSVFIIALFFIVGQYLAFIFIGGNLPHFTITGPAAFIWTLALGLWMGIIYLLLEEGIIKYSLIKRSFWFGGIVIGINWLFFNLFMILILDVPLLDPVILAGLNILSVIVGVLVFQKVIEAPRPKVRPSRFYQRQLPLPILYTGAKPWIGEREL